MRTMLFKICIFKYMYTGVCRLKMLTIRDNVCRYKLCGHRNQLCLVTVTFTVSSLDECAHAHTPAISKFTFVCHKSRASKIEIKY